MKRIYLAGVKQVKSYFVYLLKNSNKSRLGGTVVKPNKSSVGIKLRVAGFGCVAFIVRIAITLEAPKTTVNTSKILNKY